MTPASQVFAVSVLVTGCPLLLAAAVMLIRFFNSNKSSSGSDRRSNVKLRRIINELLLTGVVVLMAFIIAAIWQILLMTGFNNVRFLSPFFLISSGLIIAYALLLAGLVLFIRFLGRNKQTEAGKERRRRLFLRHALNFLMAAPVIGLVAAFIVRVLAG
jgi:hypothetical protein